MIAAAGAPKAEKQNADEVNRVVRETFPDTAPRSAEQLMYACGLRSTATPVSGELLAAFSFNVI